jgi:hypothetical protein
VRIWHDGITTLQAFPLLSMANANTISQILQRAIANYRMDCAQPVGISGTAMGLKHKTTNTDEYISARDHSTDIDATPRIAAVYKREYCRRAKVRITRILNIDLSGVQSHAKLIGQKLTAEQPDKNAVDKPFSAYVIFSIRRCWPLHCYLTDI